ncbi:MAG TPA: hypothetical protein VL693_06115 [Vicinamibacterales bacterium]|nr:hypothetical protein [Vicinamibacterales bacterium]
MAIRFRTDLQRFLADFTEHHRGVRIGQLFGLPAAYAGRRMFACLRGNRLLVKLPKWGWVRYSPRNGSEAARLIPLLEVAARHVAEAS